jgi:hypothetical protein
VRRVLAAAAIAATALLTPAPASAICAGPLCAIDGCAGTVNVCPTAQSCSGGVSVCPMAHPNDCHSSVDVCLNLVGPVIYCGPALSTVCALIPDVG